MMRHLVGLKLGVFALCVTTGCGQGPLSGSEVPAVVDLVDAPLLPAAPPTRGPLVPPKPPGTPGWEREVREIVKAGGGKPYTLHPHPVTGVLEFLQHTGLPPAKDGAALVRTYAGLFPGVRPEEIVRRPSHGPPTWGQRRDGLPVFGSWLALNHRDGGLVQVEARLMGADSIENPATLLGPDAKPAALAAANAALAEDAGWSKRASGVEYTVAEPAWYDPTMLFPESKGGPRPVFLTRGPPNDLIAVVDAKSHEVLLQTDMDEWQLESVLRSYVDPRGPGPHADVVYALLELEPGDSVLDVGAGSGNFSWPLSEKVGARGTVYANDIDDVAIDFARRRLAQEPPAHDNIRIIRSWTDDMGVPDESVNAALLHQAHFFVGKTPGVRAALQSLADAMRPGSPVVVVETRITGDLATLCAPFEAVGFKFDKVSEGLRDSWIIQLRKP
jgi:precorrin-6B methylase 2